MFLISKRKIQLFFIYQIHFHSMYCICCKKHNVLPTDTIWGDTKISEEELLWHDDQFDDINSKMISDGIISTIHARYGSSHDTDTFIIAICDECISENLEDATLLLRNSFYKDEVEKSKQLYRRRKNLDELT